MKAPKKFGRVSTSEPEDGQHIIGKEIIKVELIGKCELEKSSQTTSIDLVRLAKDIRANVEGLRARLNCGAIVAGLLSYQNTVARMSRR
jgi:hypothetical protein